MSKTCHFHDFRGNFWDPECVSPERALLIDIPAAADAPTLDELLEKISAMALDLQLGQSP